MLLLFPPMPPQQSRPRVTFITLLMALKCRFLKCYVPRSLCYCEVTKRKRMHSQSVIQWFRHRTTTVIANCVLSLQPQQILNPVHVSQSLPQPVRLLMLLNIPMCRIFTLLTPPIFLLSQVTLSLAPATDVVEGISLLYFLSGIIIRAEVTVIVKMEKKMSKTEEYCKGRNGGQKRKIA